MLVLPLSCVGGVFCRSHKYALRGKIHRVLRQAEKRAKEYVGPVAFYCLVRRFCVSDVEERVQHSSCARLIGLHRRVLDEENTAHQNACHSCILNHPQLQYCGGTLAVCVRRGIDHDLGFTGVALAQLEKQTKGEELIMHQAEKEKGTGDSIWNT